MAEGKNVAAPIISLADVSQSFCSRFTGRRQTVLSGVTFQVSSGSTFGIVGESGSGKSTLARIITGAITPDSGTVMVNGRNLENLSPDGHREHVCTIQLIYQTPQESFDPEMRLRASLMEPLDILEPGKPKQNEAMLLQLVEQVGLSWDVTRKYPHQISGGEAQRLALVRALSLSPRILVLDEATAMLDPLTQQHILRLLRRFQKQNGLTCLLISHDLDLVCCTCEHVLILHQGRVVECGPTEQITCRPKSQYTANLLAAYRL